MIRPLTLSLIALLATIALAAPATQPAAVPFDVHSGYFVSNKFEPTAAASFVILQDQKSFDRTFGTGMVMRDKSHRLASDAFDTKIVLAAIKRGKSFWEFTVKEVTEENGVLTLRYTTKESKQDSAEFACPLIITVPKGKYTTIDFIEDGISIKKLALTPSTQPTTRETSKPSE